MTVRDAVVPAHRTHRLHLDRLHLPRPRLPSETGVQLLLATSVAFAVRVVLGSPVMGPAVYHDELGYTGVARLLAGQQEVALDGPFYHPLYGALLAPVAWLFPDPSSYYRAGQVLNSALLALLVPLLYRVATDVLGMRGRAAVLAAVAASTTGGALLYSTLLLPEAFLLPLTVAFVLVAHRFASSGRVRAGAATAVTATFGFLTHPRGLAWLIAVVVLAVGLALSQRTRWSTAGITVALCAAGHALAGFVNDVVQGILYPVGSSVSVSITDRAVQALTHPVASLLGVTGPTWYLVASSLGLAAIGGVSMVVSTATRSLPTPVRLTHAFVALNVVLAIGLSMAQLLPSFIDGPPGRSDIPFYGRYVEHWLPVLLIWAIAALWRGGVRVRVVLTSVVAVTVGMTALAWLRVDDAVWDRPFAATNVSGLYLIRKVWGSFDLPAATPVIAVVVIAIALLAVAGAATSRWWVAPVLAASVALASTSTMVDGWLDLASWNHAVRSRLADRIDLSLGTTVAYDVTRGHWNSGLYNTQFWEPELDVHLADGAEGYGDAVWLLAGLVKAPPATIGARLAGTEYLSAASALWVLDDDAIAELDARDALFPPGFEDDPTVPDGADVARVEVLQPVDGPVDPGDVVELRVTHAGAGSPWPTAWPTNPVRVGGLVQDVDSGEVVIEARAEIQPILRPGESTVVELRLPELPEAAGPEETGQLALTVGVVQDDVRWFHSAEGPWPSIPVRLD